MSHFKYLLLSTLAAFVLAAGSSLAQSNATQSNITPVAKPLERDGRVVVSDQQAGDFGIKPDTTDRQRLPLEIKERMRRFELSRDAYLREQEQAKKRLLGASTEAERERIRTQIRTQREEWLRRSKAMREEAKDRVREMKVPLKPMSEVLDAARENARDAVGRQRPRSD